MVPQIIGRVRSDIEHKVSRYLHERTTARLYEYQLNRSSSFIWGTKPTVICKMNYLSMPSDMVYQLEGQLLRVRDAILLKKANENSKNQSQPVHEQHRQIYGIADIQAHDL